MYGKKKMQKGGKISTGMEEDSTSMPEENMKPVIDSENRTSKMEAEAGKKLMEVPSNKKKSLGKLPPKVRNKMGYKKKGGKVSSAYKCSHNRLY
jgi:ribosomal protein S30